MDEKVKILILGFFLGGLALIGYDEIAGQQRLSKTLRGDPEGLDLTIIKEHSGLIAALFGVVVVAYLADPRLAMGILAVLIISMVWIRRS